MNKKQAAICFIGLACLISFGLGAPRGEIQALTISPPRLEFSANPGQRISDVIKLFNETDKDQVLYTSTANFTAKEGEEGAPEFLEPEGEQMGLADWIEIERGPITMVAGERKTVPFAIKIPSFADPGGHYAAIFFGTQPPGTREGTAIGVAGKLGSLILLRVSGEIEEQGSLVEFRLKEGKKVYNHLPVVFVIGFENTGNVHLKPQGEIRIKNLLGQTSAEVEVNKGGGNVLPGTVRHFESSWAKISSDALPPSFWGRLKAEKDNFALGRYEGELLLDYGTLGQKAQARKSFWVFPWRLILVFVLGTALLVFFIGLGIRRYNRWIVSKALGRVS